MTLEDNILSQDLLYSEDQQELSLRPHTLHQYIGQKQVVQELSIYIEAAKLRQESLDHVLLFGPPGLGKTTLAMIIANEMNVNLKTTTGPALEKPGDVLALLNELQPGDILFIDEIHRLSKVIEEVLYSAMEDFYVDIMVGSGSEAHPLHFTLPPFTLVGATTRAGTLSAPFRDRFGILSHLQYYSEEELTEIILRSSVILNVDIDEKGAYEIARRSRGTPRIANRLLRRVRDYAQIQGDGIIDHNIAKYALDLLGVDEAGLDHIDRQILTVMIDVYQGKPVGLNTIAVNIGEEIDSIRDMYEPYLIQNGFIQRTPRGRIANKKAYEHLGYIYPESL